MNNTSQLQGPLFANRLQFIYQKKYAAIKEVDMTDKIYKYVIDAIQTLPVDQKYFQAIQNVIKFYGIQVLIFFQKTYKTIQNDEELSKKYQKQLKKIGRLVKNITYEKQIEEIRFFFFRGTDLKYKGKRAKNQYQLAFLDYIQKLSLKVQELKEISTNKLKKKKQNENETQKEKEEELINQILTMQIQRQKELNQFQLRFQNHIKTQVQKMMMEENNQQEKTKNNQKEKSINKNNQQKSQDYTKGQMQQKQFKPKKKEQQTKDQSLNLVALSNQNKLKLKSKSKPKQSQQQQQSQNQQDQSFLQKKPKKQKNYNNQIQTYKKAFKQDVIPDLSQVHVCCRKFFYLNEIIYQPQSLTIDYKYYNFPFKEESYQKIIRTICGFLNVQGGNIFIGIKSDRQTFKKQVYRYVLLQSQKVQFSKRMDDLISKCILPAISYDMYKIQFVPIKNKETNSFISGEFIIKIWVKYGLRKEVYSYKQYPDSKKQWFAFKTQNQVKNLDNIQQVLKITRQRLLNTPPQPRPPFHQGPCPKPDLGRPLYEDDDYVKKNSNQASSEQQLTKPKVYKQKDANQCQNLLINGFSQLQLRTHLIKKCNLVGSDFHLQFLDNKKVGLHLKQKDHFAKIKDSLKQYGNAVQLIIISKIIKSSLSKQILEDMIIHAKNNKINQIKCDKSGLITFQTIDDSLQFYISLSAMDQKARFL